MGNILKTKSAGAGVAFSLRCAAFGGLHQPECPGARCSGAGLPARDMVTALWDALSVLHRSSSLTESLHSWLRPYLQVHRGMLEWLLPLFQLTWNHHVFQRGKRQGCRPMTLAGLDDGPSLSELFNQFVYLQNSVPVPVDLFKVQEKCYPIHVGL
jgi:hypothetical protein